MEGTRAARGADIARRRDALGLSVRAFASRAGKSREAINAAELGQATLRTYEALEGCLDELESGEPLSGQQSEQDSTIEIDVTGPTTAWHVKFTGPVSQADELIRQVQILMRETGLGEHAGD